jgi:hypothetical protein
MVKRFGSVSALPLAAVLALALPLALAGCTPPTPVDPPVTSPPVTSPVPSATPTAPPTTSPTTEPSVRTSSSTLEAIDAYALCKAQTTGYYPGDFALVQFAPFESATVLLRDDGLWFVYIEVHDENREPSLVDVAASHCMVGGTIGAPQWQTFGTMTRDGSEEFIAGYNDPLEGV